MSIRIALVDDHAVVRDGLRSLLENEPDFEIVAEAADGDAAVQITHDEEVDVVIMDASMPALNGIEATRRILGQSCDARVICLSMHCDRQFVSAMLQAGASGYLPKDCSGKELIEAIHSVMKGAVYLSPAIGQVVADHFKAGGGMSDPSAFTVLTEREREVLQLLAEGQTTRQISQHLNRSEKTVAKHREHIMEKLHIGSVAGLTKYAIQQGLTTLEG